MNPFEMVVAIIVVVTIGRVLQARLGGDRRTCSNGEEERRNPANTADAVENARMRDEIRTLRERIQVLERVITENNRSMELDREIEALRDKTRI